MAGKLYGAAGDQQVLNREFFRELQLSFSKFETRATQITLRTHREYHKVVAAEQSHHQDGAFERHYHLP